MPSLQGTLVAVEGRGVLIKGPPGSGKSDLALRLIDGGAKLVADDLVALSVVAGELHGALPASGAHLAGVMEVRGIGLVRVAATETSRVDLVVELISFVIPRLDRGIQTVSLDPVVKLRGDNSDRSEERLPSPRTADIEGVAVQAIALHAFTASAPAIVRAVLKGGIEE